MRIKCLKMLLLSVLWCFASAVSGQDKHPSLADRIHIGGHVATFTKDDGLSPLALQLQCGYRFLPGLSGYAALEAMYGFRHQQYGVGEYLGSNALGGGLDYQLKGLSEAILLPPCTLGLHAACGTTLGHVRWKYTYYEAGLTLSFRSRNSVVFGAGYRLMDSRSPSQGNLQCFYGSIGFKF